MTRLEKRALELFDEHRQSGFTSSDSAKQIEKLLEEVGEFVAAVMRKDSSSALMEAGDVAWILVDILHIMGSDYLLAVGMATALEKLESSHGKRSR